MSQRRIQSEFVGLLPQKNYRILLIDTNRYDRDLLSVSLRNHLQQADILDATSAVEFAEHLAAGAVDAVISDTRIEWSTPFELVAAVRRLNPTCPFLFFSSAEQIADDGACIGHGIDANITKSSAGFLDVPQVLGRLIQRQAEFDEQSRGAVSLPSSEAFPLATIVMSDTGVIHASNTVFERMIKKPRYRYVNMLFEELLVGVDDRSRWRRVAAATHTDHDLETLDVALACGDHSRAPVRMVARPLFIDGGVARLWSAVLLDEQTVGTNDARDEMPLRVVGTEQLALEMGQMLSHDLQQPLQNVIRQTQWLLEHHKDSMLSEAIDTATHIHDSANRMQDMLDGAVMLTKIDEGGIDDGMVELEEVVESAIDNLHVVIEEAGATIERDRLPAIRGNETHLIRLFQNLIGNAVKFRGDRLPRIKISVNETDSLCEILVEDNGIGIKEGDLPRIFDIFKRLHSEDEYPGTGIGLAICKRIMESHSGRVSVESVVGRGSVFKLEFPSENHPQNA